MKAWAIKRKDGSVMARATHDNKRTKPWSANVTAFAYQAMERATMFVDAPLAVELVFYVPRPQSHYGKRGLRPSAPHYPRTKSDVDKLARCTLDALEGVVFDNDSRISRLIAEKLYAHTGIAPGVNITVEKRGETNGESEEKTITKTTTRNSRRRKTND